MLDAVTHLAGPAAACRGSLNEAIMIPYLQIERMGATADHRRGDCGGEHGPVAGRGQTGGVTRRERT